MHRLVCFFVILYIAFFKILDKCSMTQKQRIMILNACRHKTARRSASGVTKKPCVGASAHTRFRQSRLSLSSACPMQLEFERIPFLLKLNNKGYFVQKYPWQGSGESRQIQISIFEQNGYTFVHFETFNPFCERPLCRCYRREQRFPHACARTRQ